MHRQWACNLKPDELLWQLQDIPEDKSDASDDDGDEDEDYEPPKTASDSSSDCDAEDTSRLEEELKMMCSNKSCLPWILDKQSAVHEIEAQQEETEEEDETEAQEELSSWGILLTRNMLAKIMKQSEPSLTVGGVHPEDLEATMCSGNNQAQHHTPHGVSQRTQSLRPGDY